MSLTLCRATRRRQSETGAPGIMRESIVDAKMVVLDVLGLKLGCPVDVSLGMLHVQANSLLGEDGMRDAEEWDGKRLRENVIDKKTETP